MSKPIIHGRDHEYGGADPIKIAFEDVAGVDGLGSAVLWAGWHGLVDNGAAAVTTIHHTIYDGASDAFRVNGPGSEAVTIAGEEMFYDGSEGPDGTSSHGVGCYGVAFQAPDADTEIVAIQFYRRPEDGTGLVRVKLYDGSVCVTSGGGNADPGWNRLEVAPFALTADHTYVAAVYSETATPGVTTSGDYPKDSGTLVTTSPIAHPGRYPNTANELTFTFNQTDEEYFIGPIVRLRAAYTWYDGTETHPDYDVNTAHGIGSAFTSEADDTLCLGVMFAGNFFAGLALNVRLWTGDGALLSSGHGYANDTTHNYGRIALNPAIPLTNGEEYIVDWYGSWHAKDVTPSWPRSVIGAGAAVLATSVPSTPGRTGGDSINPPLIATATEYFVAPIIGEGEAGEPDIVVVATPAPGTPADVYIASATATVDDVILYWSEPNVLVSANVIAIGRVIR